MNGEEMHEVEKFNYLKVMISIDGDMGEEVAHRVFDSKVEERASDIQRS